MATGMLTTQVEWTPRPDAARVVTTASDRVTDALPVARALADRLLAEAGVRFADVIDTIYLSSGSPLFADAKRAGWEHAVDDGGWQLYRNASGVFPQIAVGMTKLPVERVAIDLKVESVAHFLFIHQLNRTILGDVTHVWRRAEVADEPGVATLGIVERHGWQGLFNDRDTIDLAARQRAYESFLTRPRQFDDDDDGFDATDRLVDRAIETVGRDVACELFFATEREFWMNRNRAGRLQYLRQQALGFGWANHDHHTYRSSRAHFKRLVATWEKLGLVCRERFYAGRQAGWGAQVMEQPVTGIVTFNDVDLSPDELMGDFSHDGLAAGDHLGTVGLWCGLHSESFLAAGMHHLEAMFSFEDLKGQLQQQGVGVMKPFTDFPYLRQAFTEGERWSVSEQRIQRLLNDGLITTEQATQFREKGAIGSHLENLERNDGFKGFNQTGVSEIIAATDPRKH